MICAPVSVSGFSSTGFMCTLGGSLAALACTAWARPISPPSAATAALFDMFCGLNGATLRPRRTSARHSPATMTDLPTWLPVPWIMIATGPLMRRPRSRLRQNAVQTLALDLPEAHYLRRLAYLPEPQEGIHVAAFLCHWRGAYALHRHRGLRCRAIGAPARARHHRAGRAERGDHQDGRR